MACAASTPELSPQDLIHPGSVRRSSHCESPLCRLAAVHHLNKALWDGTSYLTLAPSMFYDCILAQRRFAGQHASWKRQDFVSRL